MQRAVPIAIKEYPPKSQKIWNAKKKVANKVDQGTVL
jgi:hypothetical protein